jgi:hypothetical protein
MERRIPAPHYSTLLQIEDSEQAFMFCLLKHKHSWALADLSVFGDIVIIMRVHGSGFI